ncbi:hypothetical protein C488_14637 [Natrinema pellirubrum DSM 15624]|uniref:Uncharacterized protein n=1 Tax=Natrinema pellirubrum (strain DSM 15624 / CIP 106293 / JCM 10476 / NCIMB 786 / 157) TaxID=797303 RepID=L9YFQ2_NATP1|nr:hypothetical protein C488_14637 [Natrinema pellirubrum DSM 15624]
MQREPRVADATVAFAGTDVDPFVGVFTVIVEDVFTDECVVLFEWLVRSQVVSVDGQRLLLIDRQGESNRRFIYGFRWDLILENIQLILNR